MEMRSILHLMKKLETVVRAEKKDAVVDAIKKQGVGGLTILETRGQGKGDAPLVGEDYSGYMVITVVDDAKVESVLNAIADVACTGNKHDGIVFVSNVEEALDICTKDRGVKSL